MNFMPWEGWKGILAAYAKTRFAGCDATFFVLCLLLFSLPGCRSSAEERRDRLFSEATGLLQQQTEIAERWAQELSQVLTEQNRAQFPLNRDRLIRRVEKIIPLVDESSRLGKEAAEKYEEASRLMSAHQEKKGTALIAASLRKDVEIGELFKAQAQLVSDSTINDAKELNDKWVYFNGLIKQKQKDKDEQFEEGRRLLLDK